MKDEKEYHTHPLKHTHLLLYKAGVWRKMFSEETFQVIVALSLNDTVVHEEQGWGSFYITGYLITCRLVYLECKSSRRDWQHIQHYFFERVKHYIGKFREEEDPCKPAGISQEKTNVLPMHDFVLFSICPFNRGWLQQLITGKKVNPPYDDPSLTKLKDWIGRQRFCSAVDYSGAESPVIVNTKQYAHPDNKY